MKGEESVELKSCLPASEPVITFAELFALLDYTESQNRVRDQGVAGSNPVSPTIISKWVRLESRTCTHVWGHPDVL